jgi:hypothetical protein
MGCSLTFNAIKTNAAIGLNFKAGCKPNNRPIKSTDGDGSETPIKAHAGAARESQEPIITALKAWRITVKEIIGSSRF